MNKNTTYKWLEIEMRKCPPFILKRLGENSLRELLLKEVEQSLNYYTSDSFGKQTFDFLKIEGSTPNDYKYRNIQTPVGYMITSIRFVNGNLDKPAVYLIHKDFELKDTNDIKLVGEIIEKEYIVFKPKRFRWYSSIIETELIETNDLLSEI